jgi:hypothetical protein
VGLEEQGGAFDRWGVEDVIEKAVMSNTGNWSEEEGGRATITNSVLLNGDILFQ